MAISSTEEVKVIQQTHFEIILQETEQELQHLERATESLIARLAPVSSAAVPYADDCIESDFSPSVTPVTNTIADFRQRMHVLTISLAEANRRLEL